MHWRSMKTVALALFVASVGSSAASAADLYTFASPRFTFGETTPIGPTAPNAGDPTFTTSFAGPADPGSAAIERGFPSPLFSGQFLVTGAPGPLTLTFSAPVYTLSVDFGLDAPKRDHVAYFELVTSSGTLDQANTSPGGRFAGGVLTFSSSTPFTAASLDAFYRAGDPTLFAIDNLDLTTTSPVPEPATWTMLLAGFGALGFALRGAHRKTAVARA